MTEELRAKNLPFCSIISGDVCVTYLAAQTLSFACGMTICVYFAFVPLGGSFARCGCAGLCGSNMRCGSAARQLFTRVERCRYTTTTAVIHSRKGEEYYSAAAPPFTDISNEPFSLSYLLFCGLRVCVHFTARLDGWTGLTAAVGGLPVRRA
jgi:hypothetical protein